MLLRRWFQVLSLATVLALLLSACGQSAAPTATARTSTPTPVPAQSASPTPGALAPTAAADKPLPVVSGYPAGVVKEMLAQSMYLPGTTYGAGETPQLGGTGTYATKADITHEDPMTGSNTIAAIISSVYGRGGLVTYKRSANDQFEGFLAESWTLSSDQQVWTFKIRQGVKWHDGNNVTAEDIKFYIDLALFPPKGRKALWAPASFPGMKPVELVDASTVKLVFDRPNPHLLEEFNTWGYAIGFPKRAGQVELDKGNVTFGRTAVNWVAVGPYKHGEHIKGSSYRAVRFDQYWEKDEAGRALPYLDAVYFPIIPDKNVALSAFRAGRIDSTGRGAGTSMDPDMITILKKSMPGKYWIMRHTYLNYGVQMNVLKPPFNDIRVRKAVALFLDREDGARKMLGGYAFSSGLLNPGSYWYSGDYVNWPGFNQATKKQDQEEAKRLIKEAGVAGTPLTISDRNDYLFMAEYNEYTLRGLGFDPKIAMVEIGASADLKENMRYQVATGGLPSGGFPTGALTGWVTWNERSSNKTGDTKIDEWDLIVRTSADPQQRRAALFAAERYIVAEKFYNAPYLREEVLLAYRTYMKGPTVPGWAAGANSDRSTDWIDKSLR